jgi:hypothetical protein
LKLKDKYFEHDIKMYKTQIKQLKELVFKFTNTIKTQITKLDAVTSRNEKLTHEIKN